MDIEFCILTEYHSCMTYVAVRLFTEKFNFILEIVLNQYSQ